jgi:hypothetical protein
LKAKERTKKAVFYLAATSLHSLHSSTIIIMNIDNILGYKLDPKEDYYAILGCNPSSTSEQIVAEFKIRARDCHPDKCSDPQTQERFQALLEVKTFYLKKLD